MSQKNRGGRPLGRKNIEYMPVVEVPPACGKCGCTAFSSVGKSPIIRLMAGVRDGHAYDRIVWTDKECTACRQRMRVISYQKTIAPGNISTESSRQPA